VLIRPMKSKKKHKDADICHDDVASIIEYNRTTRVHIYFCRVTK
jgi:hypothetical protein